MESRQRFLVIKETTRSSGGGLSNWPCHGFGCEVSGKVPAGMEAVEQTGKTLPDLVLMDIMLQAHGYRFSTCGCRPTKE